MLTWSLFEATQNKAILDAVRFEGLQVFGRGALKGVPTEALLEREGLDLSALAYTEACLKESLRKYSVVPTVVRVAAEDIIIPVGDKQHSIARGTTLMINIQVYTPHRTSHIVTRLLA